MTTEVLKEIPLHVITVAIPIGVKIVWPKGKIAAN